MKRLKRFLCGLFLGHRPELIPDTSSTAENAYYKCSVCGQTWPYYF